MNDSDIKTVNFMKKYGGSFIQALAEAYSRADINNQAIIRVAFAKYWNHYSEMAKLKDKE